MSVATVSESVRFAKAKLDALRQSQTLKPERISHFSALLRGIDKGVADGRFSLDDLGTSPEEITTLKQRLLS